MTFAKYLSGFNTRGTSCAGLGHQIQLGRATESCLSASSPKLSPVRWLDETPMHLPNLMNGLGILTHLRKALLLNS
jgi:hypothetical protein